MALQPRARPALGTYWSSLDIRGYVAAVGATALATLIGWPLDRHFHVADTNVLMLYLLGVLAVAVRYTRGAAILASVLGVAAFDFCFVPPYLTFSVADQQYLVTFAVMLLTALTIGTLTHRVREQAEAARQRQLQLEEAIAVQARLSKEREALAEEARQAWERVEVEFLRNTLLSGVSHELRTPLSAITGAATSLIETGHALTSDSQADLLDTIRSEAERMERLITNLLDMTRLESGGLVVKKEWQPLQEVIGSALHHVDSRLAGRQVRIDLPSDLPLVHIDGVAIEQVLANLIDNAAEYTPPGSPIEITARASDSQVSVEVSDHGPGLPKGTEQRVFDKFFRAQPEGTRRGIGLGLSICRGMIEAHGGKISAANRPGGGAVFTFTLPFTGRPPAIDGTE